MAGQAARSDSHLASEIRLYPLFVREFADERAFWPGTDVPPTWLINCSNLCDFVLEYTNRSTLHGFVAVKMTRGDL